MAEMAVDRLTATAVRLTRSEQDSRVATTPFGTMTIKVAALSAPPVALSPGTIMPEGFVTYTDFMASPDSV